MSITVTKYFLGVRGFGEFEVDKKTWVEAERSCGFRQRYGRPDTEPCTGGFSSGPFIGTLRHVRVEDGAVDTRSRFVPDPDTGHEWIEGQPF